jgi:hypothetical protein
VVLTDGFSTDPASTPSPTPQQMYQEQLDTQGSVSGSWLNIPNARTRSAAVTLPAGGPYQLYATLTVRQPGDFDLIFGSASAATNLATPFPQPSTSGWELCEVQTSDRMTRRGAMLVELGCGALRRDEC